MEILKLFWLLYIDGYTLQHLVSIVWMVSINGMTLSFVLASIDRYLFWRRYRC